MQSAEALQEALLLLLMRALLRLAPVQACRRALEALKPCPSACNVAACVIERAATRATGKGEEMLRLADAAATRCKLVVIREKSFADKAKPSLTAP